MKPTAYTIPVTFDIWDTQYAITDHGTHMIIKCPCRKYERGNSQSWGLGHYTETVTNPDTAEQQIHSETMPVPQSVHHASWSMV